MEQTDPSSGMPGDQCYLHGFKRGLTHLEGPELQHLHIQTVPTKAISHAQEHFILPVHRQK